MLGNIGGVELLLIMVVILLVFGAKRIPEIARGLGHGIREFKAAAREISREIRLEDDPPARGARVSPPYRETVPASPKPTDGRSAADVPQGDLHV